MELVIFPNIFAEAEMVLKSEAPLLVAGVLEKEEGGQKILVDSVRRLEDALKKAKKLIVRLESGQDPKLSELKGALSLAPGSTQVFLSMRLTDLGRTVEMSLGDPQTVTPSVHLLNSLQEIYGRSDCVDFPM